LNHNACLASARTKKIAHGKRQVALPGALASVAQSVAFFTFIAADFIRGNADDDKK